jgi:hypothetical protein
MIGKRETSHSQIKTEIWLIEFGQGLFTIRCVPFAIGRESEPIQGGTVNVSEQMALSQPYIKFEVITPLSLLEMG